MHLTLCSYQVLIELYHSYKLIHYKKRAKKKQNFKLMIDNITFGNTLTILFTWRLSPGDGGFQELMKNDISCIPA